MAGPGNAVARAWYERVNAELARLRINWVELSRRSGVARTTMDRWRTTTRRPKPQPVLDVAAALGVDGDEALRLAGVVQDPTEGLERIRQEAEGLGALLVGGQPKATEAELAESLRAVRQAFVDHLGQNSGRAAFLRLMDELSQPRSEADHNGQTDEDD